MFGDRNELGRRDRAQAGVVPAQQCFGPDQALAAQLDLGLIDHRKVAGIQGQAQAAFDGHALQRNHFHFIGKELVLILAALLGPVHGGIGIFQQAGAVLAVVRVNRDADAGGHKQAAFANRE